ncbi:EcsC family protein [Shewanella gaetbuli]
MLSEEDFNALVQAKLQLENPGLAAKLTDYLGAPIEKGFALLPKSINTTVSQVTQAALMKACQVALFTLKDKPGTKSSNKLHKLGAALSGSVGGFWGVSAIAVELPVSTTIMLRSIADIARSEGEIITQTDAQLACLSVFALGGNSDKDDSAEQGYFAVRTVLANTIAEAAEYVASKGISKEAAPVLVKLVAIIAERFGVQVTQKVAAQAIPALGAAGGAIINTLFINHFQEMARGHFVIRRLERCYGSELIRQQYELIEAQ